MCAFQLHIAPIRPRRDVLKAAFLQCAALEKLSCLFGQLRRQPIHVSFSLPFLRLCGRSVVNLVRLVNVLDGTPKLFQDKFHCWRSRQTLVIFKLAHHRLVSTDRYCKFLLMPPLRNANFFQLHLYTSLSDSSSTVMPRAFAIALPFLSRERS